MDLQQFHAARCSSPAGGCSVPEFEVIVWRLLRLEGYTVHGADTMFFEPRGSTVGGVRGALFTM